MFCRTSTGHLCTSGSTIIYKLHLIIKALQIYVLLAKIVVGVVDTIVDGLLLLSSTFYVIKNDLIQNSVVRNKLGDSFIFQSIEKRSSVYVAICFLKNIELNHNELI